MYAVQLTLFDDFSEPHNHRACARVRGGWKPPEHIRIPGVRFAPEVSDDECSGCPLASKTHPFVQDPDVEDEGIDVYHPLCTKDCLNAGIPLKKLYAGNTLDGYELLELEREVEGI